MPDDQDEKLAPTADRWSRLGDWLATRVGARGPVRVTDVSQPSSIGYSAETSIFCASYDGDAGPTTRRLVLRSESADPPVYPPQVSGLQIEVEWQRRVMQAIQSASPSVPLAPIVAADRDASVVGAPFFVMEFVDGVVPTVDPPYTVSGFFAEARPDQRRTMIADGVRVLAAIHDVDWDAAGLGWLAPTGVPPTLARQLELWRTWGTQELRGRRHPGMDAALDILERHLPAGSAPVLCWGDPCPGNMIWRDFRCVCVTDFEAAAIAPLELDLGWWLMFDRASHEVVGAPRLEGEPGREEQRDLYEASSGRVVGDTRLYEMFAALRYTVIVVRVMNRTVARGLMPDDHNIWLENPAATCLDQLLEG